MSVGQEQENPSRSGVIIVVIPDATFALLGKVAEKVESATEGVANVRIEVKHVRTRTGQRSGDDAADTPA